MLKKLKVTINGKGKGKLASKWDGLFKVARVIKSNTYHLQDEERKNLLRA